MTPRILIVEDELPMRNALCDLLQANGYRPASEPDGARGLERAMAEPFDLLLLDVMMPRLDGFALCEAVRKRRGDVPILMLTAKSQVDDRVAGLDSGADDYLTKPFSNRELLARIRALLRRSAREAKAITALAFGDVAVDFTEQTCTRAGVPTPLTAKEIGMLRLFAERLGEPITREQFLDAVWAYNAYPTTRTVDNHVLSLRAKLEADPAHPRHLLTVHGVGYRLVEARV